MKKFLLFSASALMAMSASAGLIDVTPKAYDFNSGLNIPFVNAYSNADWGHAEWNPSVYWLGKNPEHYKDGCVLMIGPQLKANYDAIMDQCYNVVDLGGNIGKVLVINHPGSNINNVLKEAYGVDAKLPEVTTEPGYMIPFWHSDPEATYTEAEVENPIRVRVVLNIYQPTLSETQSVFQPYIQMGGNWQPNNDNEAPRNVYSGDFAYLWGELQDDDTFGPLDFATATPDDLDKYVNDDEINVWNPNRWMVYEWDVLGAKNEDDDDAKEAPIKIKMELPGSNAAIMIKSIQFFVKDAEEEGIPATTRRKSWIYLSSNPASVEGVAADAVKTLNVTVNGNTVSFGEVASVYTATGVLVAEGAELNLANGFYVAVANGKTAKFVVK